MMTKTKAETASFEQWNVLTLLPHDFLLSSSFGTNGKQPNSPLSSSASAKHKYHKILVQFRQQHFQKKSNQMLVQSVNYLIQEWCLEMANNSEFLHNPLSLHVPTLIKNKCFHHSNHMIALSSHNLLFLATWFPVPTISAETAAFAHQILLPFAEEKPILIQPTFTKNQTLIMKFLPNSEKGNKKDAILNKPNKQSALSFFFSVQS